LNELCKALRGLSQLMRNCYDTRPSHRLEMNDFIAFVVSCLHKMDEIARAINHDE